jgi:hypothetical protein
MHAGKPTRGWLLGRTGSCGNSREWRWHIWATVNGERLHWLAAALLVCSKPDRTLL